MMEPEIVSWAAKDSSGVAQRKLLALLPSTAPFTGCTFTLIEPAQLNVASGALPGSAAATGAVTAAATNRATTAPAALPRVGMQDMTVLLWSAEQSQQEVRTVPFQV
ncbi:hypothetical protein GCM10012286_20070 [Streptomyces lasiicapitis]|uniref:Uncharacterized protein n=1 Tax=Streptomyces lasiicapitis TaxID=1923961 RepID=A0ABQ2LPD7_9ACTN|nr:hypothetical protein GCM10012286_20070 [Streptomyces lasiicapitis]